MQISCVKMSDNYKPDEGGHPDGPFGMLPPAFVVPVPRLIFTQDLKVLQVSAGDLHSLLLCEDQHVYAFGCAYDGRLGIGDLAFECAECDDEDNGGDEGSGGAGAGGRRAACAGGGGRRVDRCAAPGRADVTGSLLTHCPPLVLAQILGQPAPSPAAGEVDIRPLMSMEHELEAAQSVLDNANYSLANALALD